MRRRRPAGFRRRSLARVELEADVLAFNKYLKRIIADFSGVELLRNCHPSYRAEHARRMQLSRDISYVELQEFI